MSLYGCVCRLGMQYPAVRAVLAFAVLIAPAAVIHAQAIVPAAKSDWVYYEAYANPQSATPCLTSDQAMAEAMVNRLRVEGNLCTATFSKWTSSWPNTEGRTSWRQLCPAPGIPIWWGYQHMELRGYEYTYQNSCSEQPKKTTHSIERHFFYYCADSENYELFTPPYAPGPMIPACRLKEGKPDRDKQKRDCCAKEGHPTEGNPIDVSTGNKYQRQLDYRGSGYAPLVFERHYNSSGGGDGSLGANWRHTYSRRIERIDINVIVSVARAHRADGRILTFDNVSGAWKAQPDIAARLRRTSSPAGWVYTDEDDTVERYDDDGRLQSITTRSGAMTSFAYDASGALTIVTDLDGRQLSFAYDTGGRISALTVPDGAIYQYGYDAADNLTTVTSPDMSVRTYHYGEPAHTGGGGPALAHALTGITDENSQRFATWQYDALGRGTRSEHASGADRVGIVYNTDGTVLVTDALGATRTYTLTINQGVRKIASLSGHLCRDCGQAASYVYDLNGLLNDWRDARNTPFQRRYTFDGRNLPTGEWKASGTLAAQSTAYVWHPSFRVPTQITTGNRRTNLTYDAFGNVLTRTLIDAGVTPNITRVWTYTYDGVGRVLTEDGPRADVNDVTTYSYYNCTTGNECGQLHTVTNAAGHVTTYNGYNAHGQPLTITDPNGVVTTLTYDLRQRLASRSVGTDATSFAYWPTGLLKKATLPDGSYVEYIYDAAHRLTDINDAEGNRVHYTLDAMGNRTSEQQYDPSNTLTRTRTRVFNTLNRLYQEIGAAGTASVTTTYGYDNNGNQTSIVAPLGRDTTQVYDELDRLKQVTDPLNGVTKYVYNNLDQLTSVTDPRGLVTSYSYNALGDLKQQTSPDTGVTNNTYDSGGNLATSTDARNTVATYTYDDLNRVATASFASGSTTDQVLTYAYDAGTYGIGRLTRISDANHSLSWGYDEQGRLLSQAQAVGSISKATSYTYANGLRQNMMTPSGQVISYGYTNGKITSVSVNGTLVVSNILYDPFGPMRQWTWADGSLAVRTFDQDGSIALIDSAGLKSYSYDDAFRITGVTDTTSSALSWTYGYDDLDRLTSASRTGTALGYSYDANGNRLTETGSNPSTFTIAANSNRLSSTSGTLARTYGYDAAGNTTSFTGVSFTYNSRGRMSSSTKSGVTTSYVHNAIGQLIQKGASTLYYYDDAGHILGIYDGGGALKEEVVWLGDTPIATLRSQSGGGISIYNIHTDHLNTPRIVTDSVSGAVRWRWDGEPFGGGAVNDNPSGAGVFEFGLRFPGQIAIAETGLFYNYFRDYDPSTGRYVQSDPIGLDGGLSTYLYADANPISKVDPTGENAWAGIRGAWWVGTRIGGAINYGIGAAIGTSLGSALYDVCNSEADDEAERCKDVEEKCFEECEGQLGVGGRTNQGTPYRNCRVRCLKRHGCYKGNSPVE